MDALKQGADALFILLGAIMVLAMHAGFAFLELGTVRKKNQVNALVKILVDFSLSTVVYFLVGYGVAYGTHFFVGAEELAARNGYDLVKFFFLLTFAAAIPAIISGGIAERARFFPQLLATAIIVGFVYPFYEGIAWNQHFGFQAWLKAFTGEEFHDFAGSVVVHAMGGWIALPAVLLVGARHNRYRRGGGMSVHPPSSIPFLALGAWILMVGWFGFNVMSAQTLDKISGLVALNSLMAMVGGTLAALVAGRNDPGFVHNGPLAGLVAVCAGSDLMHPVEAHPDTKPLENRRCAGGVALARAVRHVGWTGRRAVWSAGIGRPGWGGLHRASLGHRLGDRLGLGRRLCHLRLGAAVVRRPEIGRRTRVHGRRPQLAPHRRDARS